MKQFFQLHIILIFSLTLCSCSYYEVRQVHSGTLNQDKYGVCINDLLIPEFTHTTRGEYALNKAEAETLLNLRRNSLKDIIWNKYERPHHDLNSFLFGTILLVVGPIADVAVNMPALLIAKITSDKPVDFLWFPTTRMGYYELFYGPLDILPLGGPLVPKVRAGWQSDKQSQLKLQDILRETDPHMRSISKT